MPIAQSQSHPLIRAKSVGQNRVFRARIFEKESFPSTGLLGKPIGNLADFQNGINEFFDTNQHALVLEQCNKFG